jgi:hypothetical protein
MKKTSTDASTVADTGGTTHALEARYGRLDRRLFSRGIRQGVADLFWHHLISQPKAIRNRMKIVSNIIEGQMVALFHQRNNEEVSILSIAGGSSRSIMYALDKILKSDGNRKISVITIDKDKSALEIGKTIAAKHNLGKYFQWINGIASDVNILAPNRVFDIIEIVGLLDYFSDERAIRLLSMSRELMKNSGHIVIANVMSNNEKPFIHKAGWPSMYYRTPDEVGKLLERSGFRVSNLITEPLCVHCIGVGQKVI